MFLHNVLTLEDIAEMKKGNNAEKLKRNRPDTIFKHSVDKIVPPEVSILRELEEDHELRLESFTVHFLFFAIQKQTVSRL